MKTSTKQYTSLIEWMQDNNWTMSELAREFEVDYQTVRYWVHVRVSKRDIARRLGLLSNGALTEDVLMSRNTTSSSFRPAYTINRSTLLRRMLAEFTNGPDDVEMCEFIRNFVASL